MRELDLPYATFRYVTAQGTSIVCVAGGPTSEPVVLRVDVDGGEPEVLRPARDLGLDPAWFSCPEHVTFPTEDDGTGIEVAHALVYPPTNPEDRAADGDLPPLMVVVHGGPTAGAVAGAQPGGPVLDVPRASAWPTSTTGARSATAAATATPCRAAGACVDLDDVVVVRPAPGRRRPGGPRADGDPGGSAGGYTTLAALTMRPGVFTAGASHFGVADLGRAGRRDAQVRVALPRRPRGAVAVGADVYAERSPINHVDALDTPLAVFQGDEDEVVPPDQAEAIVAALRAKGVPHAYLLFPGEQHGFRKAENIRAALDGELSFYAQVWGFELPTEEGIDPDPVVTR